MSFYRFIYYCAIIGGWAAFLGWLICELVIWRKDAGPVTTVIMTALVGTAIGGGLNVVGGLGNAQWQQLLIRLGIGLAAGVIGGAVGGTIGELLVKINLPRAIGWAIMGMCIGVANGLFDRSISRIRNGLIGGTLGGLVGGLLFNPIVSVIASESGKSGRALGFVILGMCIGALIGLVQVVLKEAWLTVMDGYRTGRQLILSAPVTVLGRGEHVSMPFLGQWGKDLEVDHVRVVRQPNGSYVAEDNDTNVGTRVNRELILGPTALKDGDVIALGANYVRFNERHTKASAVPIGKAPRQAALVASARGPAPDSVATLRLPPGAAPKPAMAPPAAAPRPAQPPAPPPAAKPVARPAAPATVRATGVAAKPAGDGCPKCGRPWPGKPGSRHCLVDDLMY